MIRMLLVLAAAFAVIVAAARWVERNGLEAPVEARTSMHSAQASPCARSSSADSSPATNRTIAWSSTASIAEK